MYLTRLAANTLAARVGAARVAALTSKAEAQENEDLRQPRLQIEPKANLGHMRPGLQNQLWCLGGGGGQDLSV